MSENQLSAQGHAPTKHPKAIASLFLKLMKSKPFEGGPMSELSDVQRLLSGYSSAFLLPINSDKTEFALIDAGADAKAEEILAVLQYQGATADAVKAIFITHGHPDHIAGIRHFPAADVYVGAEDKAYVEGTAKADGPLASRNPELAIADPTKLKVVEDGQTITVGQRSIRAFKVPGHTKGSVVYLLDNVLFIGDVVTFNKNGKVLKPPKPFSFSVPQAIESLRKLIERFDSEGIVVQAIVPNHSGAGTIDDVRLFLGQAPHP